MLILLIALSLGQSINLKDEGVPLGWVRTLDCTGSGITCSVNNTTRVGTVAISGGGGGGVPDTIPAITYSATADLSAERVLSAGNYSVIDLGTAAQAQVDWIHGLTCSAGQALTSASTSTMACTSTITASDLVCAGTCVADAEIAALAASKLTGTVIAARGGLGAAQPTCAAGTFLTCNGTTCSCATPAGAGAWTNVDVDFGTAAKLAVAQSVTDAAVGTTSKIIVQQLGIAPAGRQADEAEMDALLCRAIPASGSFKLICTSLQGATHGTHRVVYQVN